MIAGAAIVCTAAAQTGGREITVEESYLQSSIELMIISETARAATREQKNIALAFIGDAIDRGNTNDEIRKTLEFLSLEGTRSIARESGRVTNNFPDVRRVATMYLGLIGTEEARKSLIEVLKFEREPMVIQEAIKSLGDIGTNENNETIANIAWWFSRFDTLNPDNLMALATIDAFEKIAAKSGGLNDPEAFQLLIRISEGNYITPVRERARQLLSEMRSMGR